MRQERLYRTEAIVLRQLDYGEADRILTLLTPAGKVSAIAKGIRRPTSRKVGHLGLFYRAQLMLARGRNLDVVTQAESLEEFEGIRGDLLRFTYACYAGELMGRFIQEEEESAALYELMSQGLRRFAVEEDLRLWMRFFELRLLSLSGYQPELFACVHCHERIQPVTNFYWPESGGLLCPRCSTDVAAAVEVSVNSQKVLRFLMTHAAGEVRALRVSEATHKRVEELTQDYVEYTLEREVQSVTFLRRLRRDLQEAANAAAPSHDATAQARPEQQRNGETLKGNRGTV